MSRRSAAQRAIVKQDVYRKLERKPQSARERVGRPAVPAGKRSQVVPA